MSQSGKKCYGQTLQQEGILTKVCFPKLKLVPTRLPRSFYVIKRILSSLVPYRAILEVCKKRLCWKTPFSSLTATWLHSKKEKWPKKASRWLWEWPYRIDTVRRLATRKQFFGTIKTINFFFTSIQVTNAFRNILSKYICLIVENLIYHGNSDSFCTLKKLNTVPH